MRNCCIKHLAGQKAMSNTKVISPPCSLVGFNERPCRPKVHGILSSIFMTVWPIVADCVSGVVVYFHDRLVMICEVAGTCLIVCLSDTSGCSPSLPSNIHTFTANYYPSQTTSSNIQYNIHFYLHI